MRGEGYYQYHSIHLEDRVACQRAAAWCIDGYSSGGCTRWYGGLNFSIGDNRERCGYAVKADSFAS